LRISCGSFILFIDSTRHDFQGIIRQRPLQGLGFASWRAYRALIKTARREP
jgi:hypothetical protein